MRKRVIGAVAVGLVGVITAGTVLTHVAETAYAQESFVGIDSIIEEHGETNPFTIVELVPDYRMAKLGYFVEGSEPFYYDDESGYQSYQEHLANLDTAEARREYMGSLETLLASISTEFPSMEELERAENVTTALSYVPYEESYAEFSGAQKLELAEMEELPSGTDGYEMTKVDDGAGSYTLDDDYHVAAAGENGTHYDQNISYYSTVPTNEGENYYDVTFAYSANPTEGEDAYVVAGAEQVNSAESARDLYTLVDGVYVKTDSVVEGNTWRVTFAHTVVVAPSAATGGEGDEDNNAGGEGDNAGGEDNNAGGEDNNAGGEGDNAGGEDDDAGGEDNNAGGEGDNAGGDDNSGGGEDNNAGGEGDNAGGEDNNAGGDDNNAGGEGDNAGGDDNIVGGDDNNAGGEGNNVDGDDNNAGGDDNNAGGEDNNAGGDDNSVDGEDENVVLVGAGTLKAAAQNESTVYYQVSGVAFDSTASSTYGAVLNAGTPYVESANGHFVCQKTYTQAGEGEGNYTITESENGELDGTVKIAQVYYTGGYVNNNLFKQAVFNQSGLLDAAGASDISIKVVAMTAADYNSYTGDTDLLYVSDSSQVVQTPAGMGTYGAENDLSDMTVDELYQQVYSDTSRLPVILDYGIMTDSTLENTGIRKLATLLTASVISSDNIKRTVDSDGRITVALADSITEFTDTDHFYVHENVLVVPSESTAFSFMDAFETLFLDDSRKDETTFQEDAEAIGFGDVASTIVTENMYRNVENEALGSGTYGLYSQTISKATATEYIISYVFRREEYTSTDLRVLDIEPCTTNASTKTTIEENIKKMLNFDASGGQEITFVHMTSAEFISKVEDLCEYDMIYLGLYTDRMNTSNGRTVYNDSSMNGLVYTNIGDIRYDQHSRGLLDTEYADTSNHYAVYKNTEGLYTVNTSGSKALRNFNWNDANDRDNVRYSGNDLTEEKLTAIKNFLKSGSPVVLADNFLTTGADGNTYVYDFQYDADGNKITTSNGYIDNCSRMYELIKDIKDASNVMTESSVLGSNAKKKTLMRYITLGKPVLTVNAGAKESGQEYYKTVGSKITMKFGIENFGSADAGATFNCYLYADYNADGRYAASEMIAANNFKISLNGVVQTAKSTTDDEGNDVYYYELSPTSSSTQYTLTYDISDNYVGVLPIKLKVSQSTNSYRYDSEELYFYKTNTTGNKVKIKVLQILAEWGWGNVTNDNLGERGVYDGTLDPNSQFYKQLHSAAMKDYDMTIHAMKPSTFLQQYRDNPDFLDEYDMLILGFADCYYWEVSDNDTVEIYNSVSNFIATGKSVLFTHDTTSYNNNPNNNGDNGWASNVLNKSMTADVGFDRYGVFSSHLVSAGIKNLTSTSTTVYNVNNYYSLKLAKEAGTLTKDSYTGAELFQLIVDEAKANHKDIAYKPNSDKTALVTEVQGQSSMTINGNSSGTYYNMNGVSGGLPTTTKVEMLNEGQILVYPFNLLGKLDANKTMTVSTTHGQYFQIDMNEDADQDGESDVTVWLSLTGNSEYDAANRDARNNYYIYTKGNVTYSGVGHSKINYDSNVAEIQLYINTMVTAYSAGARSPSISLKQSSDANAAELGTIYVGMDSKVDAETGEVADGEQVDTGTERIYYTVSDTNVTQGGTKKVAVNYYLVYDRKEDAPESLQSIGKELTINDTTVFAIEQNWDTYKGNKTTPETSLDNITTGVTYACDVPYSILEYKETVDGVEVTKTLDEATIWVVATTNIWRQGVSTSKKPSGSYPAYDYLKVQRIGLFDLD